MAVERDERVPESREERSSSLPRGGEEKERSGPRKKRQNRRGMSVFFLLMLLAAGVGLGLHYSGIWDGRDVLYTIIPQIPWGGPRLAQLLEIPREFTLTATERRRGELEERERLLHVQAMSLDALGQEMNRLSLDLALRTAEVMSREDALAQAAASRSADEAGKNIQDKEIKELLRVYSEMSPRNAAQIMETLNENLAVALLSRMPQDQAALILAKVDPAKAALLTERLSKPSKQ